MYKQDSSWRDDSGPLRVGITGHREERLSNGDLATLRLRVREVLVILGRLGGGTVTVVSPLADGADQLVAEEALRAGFRLECPLPFPLAEYLLDFEADATAFRSLLERAAHVEELPGSRTSPESRRAAYAAVGAQVVRDAHLLLAIWDGQKARGEGGTAEVVELARRQGLPIVWIDARPPHHVDLLGAEGQMWASLSELFDALACNPTRNG